jgi:hypothetical protein
VDRQPRRDRVRDLVLDGEDLVERRLDPVGPQAAAALDLDQLAAQTQAAPQPLDRAANR